MQILSSVPGVTGALPTGPPLSAKQRSCPHTGSACIHPTLNVFNKDYLIYSRGDRWDVRALVRGQLGRGHLAGLTAWRYFDVFDDCHVAMKRFRISNQSSLYKLMIYVGKMAF